MTKNRKRIAWLEAALAEIERRLTLPDGYTDSDRIRMALLHIDSLRERRPSRPDVSKVFKRKIEGR